MPLRVLYCLLLWAICLCNVQASHVLGGEISYQCLNSATNTYEIKLKLYRDCNGIAMPTATTVEFSTAGGCFQPNLTLTLQNIGGTDVSQLCSPVLSSCNGGTAPGVEEYVYTGTTTLAANCGEWIISYGTCCRSGSITNLQNPSTQGMTLQTTLDSDVAACNSSVQFSNMPLVYTYAGNIVSYNHGAYDPDGDSLRFTLTSAQDDPLANIPFVGGLSANIPLIIEPTTTFVLDTTTGQLTFTPISIQSQQAVVTLLVEEIRNGVVIASTFKEMQVVSLYNPSSSNNPVQLDSLVLIENGNSYLQTTNIIEGCIGQAMHLQFYFSDNDVMDSIQYDSSLSTLQQTYPNAIITITHPTPTASNQLLVDVQIPGIISGTAFSLALSDNGCPITTRTSLGFIINERTNCAEITGNVVLDGNNNCTYDPTDLAFDNAYVIIEKGSFSYAVRPDLAGNYRAAVDTGTYTVRVEPMHPYWSSCTAGTTSTLPTYTSVDTVNFALEAAIICPLMYVNIAAQQLTNCRDNHYHVNYCNYGTDTAFGAYIEVELDTLFRVDSTSLPIASQVGNLYTFFLGDVAVNDCGNFYIYGYLDPACDVAHFGRTFCAKAHAYPDSTCFTPAGWSGADLIGEVQCLGDSVALRLHNTGNAMTSTQILHIIKDGYSIYSQSFSLGAGMSTPWFTYYADGATFRIEAAQAPNHPWQTAVSATVEGCVDTANVVSTGFVHIYDQNDAAPFVSIDCQIARFSWDPNDKQGFPVGYGAQHAIDKNTSLKYRIRFQNTGTAPALDVQIKDEISAHLDIFSIEVLGASHPYNWTIDANHTLWVNFPNINLPDSVSNEPASHGYVDFRIKQVPNNPVGTVINNTAEIYFDQNPAVITNTVFHTIDTNFIVPLVAYQIDTTVCDSFVFDNTTYTNSGVYNQGVYQATEYSSYTIDVDIDTINTSITQNGTILISNQQTQINTTYQWVDCDDNNSPIIGANGQAFSPIVSGNYAVQIMDGACNSLSDCVNVTILPTTGIEAGLISIYPNPIQDILSIEQQGAMQVLQITVTDQLGRLVKRVSSEEVRTTIDVSKWASGLYFVTIQTPEKTMIQKIIKQ